MLVNRHQLLAAYIERHPEKVGKVVDYDKATDRLYAIDLTANNHEITITDIADTVRFESWISGKLAAGGFRYAVGGYLEHRTIYARSALFDNGDEPRRMHLGIDIWAPEGTPVYSPLAGIVHSFKDNTNFGDYGPTIILQHDLDGLPLYTLYGHLSRESLMELYAGKPVQMNQQIAQLGNAGVNGGWPPHLHFQLMFHLHNMQGDYPGVCRYSETETYRANVPDPALILRW